MSNDTRPWLQNRCHACGAQHGEMHTPDCYSGPQCACGMLIGAFCRCRKPIPMPYIASVNHCARCGARNPEFFRVPDRIWRGIVRPQERRDVICRPCFDDLVKVMGAHRWKTAGEWVWCPTPYPQWPQPLSVAKPPANTLVLVWADHLGWSEGMLDDKGLWSWERKPENHDPEVEVWWMPMPPPPPGKHTPREREVR